MLAIMNLKESHIKKRIGQLSDSFRNAELLEFIY